jgi:hypothetical protein
MTSTDSPRPIKDAAASIAMKLPPTTEQRERGQDEREPADADRGSAEVAHVGIERLPSCQGEKHRAYTKTANVVPAPT